MERAREAKNILIKVSPLVLALTSLLSSSSSFGRLPPMRLMNLYDPNTELILEGWALRPFPLKSATIENPVVLPLSLGPRTVLVILGPYWYISRLGVSIKRGQRVRVIGSKVYGPRGRIYIIARKIFLPDRKEVFTFRNENYIPGWILRPKATFGPRR